MVGARRALVLVACLTGGALALIPGQALAGPVILGGDDLHDHGSVNLLGQPQDGWLYMEKAIANLSSNVTRANDNSIAAIGSSAAPASASSNAGAAIGVAGSRNGMPVNYHDGPDAINAFFAQLASGAARPKIVWLAGTGATNSYDASGGCSGSENEAVTANATQIDRFVSQGGGLMSHGTCYEFLSALLPGLTTVNSGQSGDLVITPAGQAAFPGLTNDDVNAGPWHNHFDGNFGRLQVLVESTSVRNRAGGNAAVVLGGSAVTITPPSDLAVAKSDRPDPATARRNLTYTLTVRNHGQGTANEVTLTDDLPGRLRSRSVRTSQGTCTGGAVVSCNLGQLTSGAAATVRIVIRPARAGSIVNTATVATSSVDENMANNTTTETTRVRSIPSVGVRGVPRACTASGFTARISIVDTSRITSVRVFLDRRRLRSTRRKRFRVVVPAGRLSSGSHRVRVVVRNSSGARRVVTRRFTRCVRRAAPRFTG